MTTADEQVPGSSNGNASQTSVLYQLWQRLMDQRIVAVMATPYGPVYCISYGNALWTSVL